MRPRRPWRHASTRCVPTNPPAAPSKERAIWEKEVLGFQFGDHPFMEAAAWLANQISHDTSQLTSELSGERVKIFGGDMSAGASGAGGFVLRARLPVDGAVMIDPRHRRDFQPLRRGES